MTETRWKAQQVEAIRSLDHTLLEANAGTGKTTTVIGAILWRLGLDVGVDEHNLSIGLCPPEHRLTLDRIAAITFTEKAAYDLKRKLREEIQRRASHLLWDIDRAVIGTIHSFCGEVLREHALRFGIDPTFGIMDEREALLEQEDLAKAVVLEALGRDDEGVIGVVGTRGLQGSDYKDGTVDYVMEVFRDLRWRATYWQRWVQGDRLDRKVLKHLVPSWTDDDEPPIALCESLVGLARELERRWEKWMADENMRDFDALILSCRDLLNKQESEPALASIRRRFGLLVIDEFQDTDGAQQDIAFRIAGLGGDRGTAPQLLMVGDPKQSIYRFRGADVTVWNEVVEALGKHGRKLSLVHNFRSAPAVVEYVNRACPAAFQETGSAVEAVGLRSRVPYVTLEAARPETDLAGVEWLSAAGLAADRRTLEAQMVAARIREIVIDETKGDREGIEVIDPSTGTPRPCGYRDVAILFRSRTPVPFLTEQLDHYGVPYYLAGDAGLKNRLEVVDILTLLRLLENPLDDLGAFAFLRSPFVGLRDEIIARIRLEHSGESLLKAAGSFVRQGEWFVAPEHSLVSTVEREALTNGLAVVDELRGLPSRIPIHRLVEEAVERTGYRLHLLLMPQPESRLANLERFIGLLEGYRNQTVGTFLEIWDRWEARDLGVPQAPLYSKADNVVTLSTIHAAKGLEWPIVFLVDSHGKLSDRSTNAFWADRELGPVLCPRQDERGDRTNRLSARNAAEERAEDARLMYVATTRARDRLIIAGPTTKADGVAKWLTAGRDASVSIAKQPANVRIPDPPPVPLLTWMEDLYETALPPLVSPVQAGPMRFTHSATELMTRLSNGKEWRQKYVHGLVPLWVFSRVTKKSGVPASARGVVVHGVLERIREEGELADLLELAIGALGSPDLEEYMSPGTEYRVALENELRVVIGSPEWRSYVEGEHWRELWFVHFRRPRKWRVGAFDLYRRGDSRDLIVDFKTHGIGPEAVEGAAADYKAQVQVYRAAAKAAGRDAEVRLHFTRPNRVWSAG